MGFFKISTFFSPHLIFQIRVYYIKANLEKQKLLILSSPLSKYFYNLKYWMQCLDQYLQSYDVRMIRQIPEIQFICGWNFHIITPTFQFYPPRKGRLNSYTGLSTSTALRAVEAIIWTHSTQRKSYQRNNNQKHFHFYNHKLCLDYYKCIYKRLESKSKLILYLANSSSII